MPTDRPVSSLVLAELYDSGDASFLQVLLTNRGSFKPLLGLVERWKKDKRPWAQRLKIDFVLSGQFPLESRVVLKRLFKQAWVDGDSELLAALMVALDCAIRRQRAKRYSYVNRVIETTEVLRLKEHREGWPFSHPTTHYLRRRAWRYFRRLGFEDAGAYIAGITSAIVRYVDDDVRAGENLLDNWGLMHACFGKSPAIKFSARHTNLSVSGRLSQLQAAPMFERHWALERSMPVLIDILLRAQCRPVRIWAIQLLRRLHAGSLPKLEAETLLKLIDHADADVAAFAAELLENAQAVSAFPMATWMGLLATRNPAVVDMICVSFRKHVNFDRVTLAQAVELATRVATSVANLGLEILGQKAIRSDSDFRELARLARAQCQAVGALLAQFALSRLNVPGQYRVEEIIAFFDNRLRPMRSSAFAALVRQSPADTDPAFWARLFESPYDDVRIELVRLLKLRQSLPGASADVTATLWQSVLLNIHRGGRAKLSALRQISDSIAREPQNIRILLPVLAVAIRSVRPPEARHGLAAVVGAVERIPSIADDVQRFLPELRLDMAGSVP